MSLHKIIILLGGYLVIFNFSFGQKTIHPPQLEFDHIVIFTQSSELKNSLSNVLFTLAEKASSSHYEQGTEGHYFFFYNTYIELLYLNDTIKAIANEPNFGSPYTNRWKRTQNHCPIGFGLNLIPFDTTLIKSNFKVYKSSDSPDGEFYLMSKFNTQQEQPLIYLSMPHHAYLPYDSLNEVDERFEEYMRADQKSYLTHLSEVKRLTEIILTIPPNADSKGNIDILRKLSPVKITHGNTYGLTLIFDNQAKGKEVMLSNDFQLIIKY